MPQGIIWRNPMGYGANIHRQGGESRRLRTGASWSGFWCQISLVIKVIIIFIVIVIIISILTIWLFGIWELMISWNAWHAMLLGCFLQIFHSFWKNGTKIVMIKIQTSKLDTNLGPISFQKLPSTLQSREIVPSLNFCNIHWTLTSVILHWFLSFYVPIWFHPHPTT